MRGQQIIQRGDRPSPRNVARDLEPLGVLIEHRIHDVNKRLIAGKEPVPSREQIAFQPALAQMLAQHFHDPPVGRHMVVVGKNLRHRCSGRSHRTRRPAVRSVSSGPKTRKLSDSGSAFITSRKSRPARASLRLRAARVWHLHRVLAKIRHVQIAQQQSAVGMWIGAHAARRPSARARPVRHAACPYSSKSSSGL